MYQASIGAIIALLTIVTFFMWIICRLCSGNCGEANCCRTGFFCKCFCGTGGANLDGYTKRQRIVLALMLFFAMAGVTLCGLIGARGVNNVVHGTQEMFAQAMTAITTMQGVSTTLQDALTALGQTFDGSEMTSAVASVKTDVGDLESKVDDNADNVKKVAYTFYAFFAINCLLGFSSYITNAGCFSMLMAVNGFLLSIVCWLLFAILYASGAFLDDTCIQLQLWNDCNAPNADRVALGCSDLVLQKEIDCPNATVFTPAYGDSYDNIYSLIQGYNAEGYASTYSFAYPNGTGGILPNATAAATDYPDNTVYRLSLYNAVPACTPGSLSHSAALATPWAYMASCMSTCSDSIAGPTYSSQACHVKAILTAADATLGLAYMGSCSYLTAVSAAATVSGSSCDSLGDGFIYQFAAQGSIGAIYFFVIFIGIQGFHAWQWQNYAENVNSNQEKLAQQMVQQQATAPGSVSANTGQVETVLERYSPFKADKLSRFIDEYYSKWHGVAGPLVECHFHTLLSNGMIEMKDHGTLKEGAMDEDDEDEDEDEGN